MPLLKPRVRQTDDDSGPTLMKVAQLSPADVVTRAYWAANRGRFSSANKHVTTRLRRMLYGSAKGMRSTNAKLLRLLRRIKAPGKRTKLREFVAGMRQFEDPHFCWKGSTQGGTIRTIEVLRQTKRNGRAVVKVALHLADGRTRVERCRLHEERNRWLIDTIEVEVLPNNELQRTRPAQAREPRR